MTPKQSFKPITSLPLKPGSYNIQINGVMTMMPLFLSFDGEKWLDIESVLRLASGDINQIYYYDDNSMQSL